MPFEKITTNASMLENELEKLRNDYCDIDLLGYRSRYRYRDFWAHAKLISNMFRSLKPISREDRSRLWSEFSAICNEVKSRQNEEREESLRNRGLIETMITDAYYQAGGARDRDEINKATAMQNEILGLLNTRRIFREDREYLKSYLKQVNERIHSKRVELQESNFLGGKEAANGASRTAYYGDPYEALKEIQEVQRSLRGVYMNRDQRKELYEILEDGWEKAQSRIGELKEEKRRRHQEWLERMNSHIERWEKKIQDSEHFISRLEDQIDELEDQKAHARTDEHAQKVRIWIEQKMEKIRDVRNQIQELEDKIYSVRGEVNS